jgi:hypothetical protein
MAAPNQFGAEGNVSHGRAALSIVSSAVKRNPRKAVTFQGGDGNFGKQSPKAYNNNFFFWVFLFSNRNS